jgi:hypothetical protein
MARRFVLMFLVIASVTVTGCNQVGKAVAQDALKREMTRLIGPADNYDVDVEGLRADQGTASAIRATGRNVRPRNAPVIENLRANFTDVRYDRTRGQVDQVGSARVDVALATAAIESFLEKNRNIKNVQLKLEAPQRVTIRATPEMQGLSLPAGINVSLSGRLQGAGTQVRFEVDRVSAIGIDISSLAAKRISDEINPLIDLSNMPVVVNVGDVRVEGTRISATATGRLPNPLFRGPKY